MPTIADTIKTAADQLQKSGVIESRREAGSLLAFALGKSRTFLITESDRELTDGELEKYMKLVERRAAREPFQYIVGRKEFFGLEFFVTSDVLIPRPETELIVENALDVFKIVEQPRFCEVGVGSGCISISILVNSTKATAIGLEISPAAIEVARRNAGFHSVLARFDVRLSDVFGGAPDERFDMIVSNPPYVPAVDIDGLQPEVKDHEPHNALTDGGDGLAIVRQIAVESPRFLNAGGTLLMEIGFGQADEVRGMFASSEWSEVEIVPDLQSIPRMVRARLRQS